MGDAGFFKGTSSEQDTRFKDKEKSLLKSINFPKELDQKVDMRKVELSVMRPWIAEKIMQLLGFEDEVVVEYVNGLLEDPASPIVDPKRMQINLTGFLESKTGPFMSELWALLISAQQSPLKIPALFIEQKKEEMRKREQADLEAQELIKQKREQEEEKERRLAEIRRRERSSLNNRTRDPLPDAVPPRNGIRPNPGSGPHHRPNFMPPRDRDSGWGSRGGGRLSDGAHRARDPALINTRRPRSRSPAPSRRDHPHRDHPSSYRRRSYSRSSSRSRSPPHGRPSRRRPSPSPPPAKRPSDPSKSHRRGSPVRAHRTDRPPSSSSESPPRSSRRRRSPSRSPSPPRRRVSDLSLNHDPDAHSRPRERDHRSRDRRRQRAASRSRSPLRKRTRDEPQTSHRARESRSRREKSRSWSPSREGSTRHGPYHSKDSRSRRAKKAKHSSSSRSRSPSSVGRSSLSSRPQKAGHDREETEEKKKHQPPVISIKGRASKLVNGKSSEQAGVEEDGETKARSLGSETKEAGVTAQDEERAGPEKKKNLIYEQASRPHVLSEVVKERLLREKVKASMNQR